MASLGNMNSEPPEIEQIVTEFFAKSLHIILESRSPYVSSRNYSGDPTISPSSSSSSSSSVRPRDKWFRLALRDCPAALENIDFWRQSNLEPMVVDVILVQRPHDWDPINCIPRRDLVRNTSLKEQSRNSWGSEQEEFGCVAKSEKIIERWVVQYESRKNSSLGSKRSSNSNSHNLLKIQHTLYKKSIILLRSLYLTVRLLPAYKLYHDLNSSQIHAFTLAHRVSSIIEPFTGREEVEMQRFCFTPVDTCCGRLCLSVLYRASLSDVSSEPSTPMSPQVIADYVGSPMADPLKRFPSLPTTCSPSSAPFSRRHSWSYDLYRASPPSVSFSPSPTHSESRASVSNPASQRLPPMSLPPHPPEMSAAHHKNTGFDEYWPSPTISPPSSASPPTNTLGSHLPKSLLRSESAPVSIPATKPVNTPALPYKHNLPPSPPLKGTGCSNSKTDRRPCQIRTGTTVDKISIGKDETGKISGLKISSGSSQPVSVSRSSSRLSLPDDFDGSEFSCPFITDDDDVTDSYRRPESYDHKRYRHEPVEPGGVLRVPKSQGAEVGALVLMLKTAAPLCQDLSSSTNFSQAPRSETWNNSIQLTDQISEAPVVQDTTSSRVASSGLVFSKTTADALEELKVYKDMKNDLIKQGLRSQTSTNLASAAEVSCRGTTG